jgi:restriction system protein
MKKELETLAPSKKSAAKTVYATFNILQKEGGQLLGKQVIDIIRNTIEFSDWENEVYEKTGYVRWESILHLYTVDCVKAGFLRKHRGTWYLTEDGEKVIKLGPLKLLESISERYRNWVANNKLLKPSPTAEKEVAEFEESSQQAQKAKLDLLEGQAIGGIKEYIRGKTPYEFQDMVAALLRTMGYHTPFISPKGKDGGLDIIAYSDPLGLPFRV